MQQDLSFLLHFILYIHVDKQHRVGELLPPLLEGLALCICKTSRGEGAKKQRMTRRDRLRTDSFWWRWEGWDWAFFGETMLDSVPSHAAQQRTKRRDPQKEEK